MSERIFHIKCGRVQESELLRKQFRELQDGTYTLKVSPRKVRSLSQNAYYWGVVVDMVKDGLRNIGFSEVKTSEDAHEVIKGMFLRKTVVNNQTGEILMGSKSTTELTTAEFTFFIEQIQKWAAEYLGISIPSPNE